VNIILKNHYTIIGKYIYVIFLSLFVIRRFRGMGVGRRDKALYDFESRQFFIKYFSVTIL